ncbi:MAG: response regulator transcription factor [Flavobacteriales bacterium]|nr:response regulator transcription factor [Flavobacteriales bacterium]
MKVAIVDNEEGVREGLKEMLSGFCPEAVFVGEANGVKTGLEMINNVNPQIVLLDVEMDDGTGMDLLSQFEKPEFATIFVTAHDKYAVNAFKFSAIDFILKPVDPEDLITALEKAAHRIASTTMNKQLSVLIDNIRNTNQAHHKIVLKDAESIHFVEVSDILYCMAEGSYTLFKLVNGDKIFVSKNLKEYEKMLDEYNFYRTHHSYVANLNHVVRFDKKDGGTLILKGETHIPVSFRKKEGLVDRLNAL